MSILITGVAGFIGTNLANLFIKNNESVIGIDNLSRGKLINLKNIEGHKKFYFKNLSICDYLDYLETVSNYHKANPITEIWHLAANSDIPAGIKNVDVDLYDTFITTFNTLKIMKDLKIPIICFASSSAIYGDLGNKKLTEDIGPLLPISNYGAMKLASEAAISASIESNLDKAFIFRFPNVIGTPATHGVILDFINKLRATPRHLNVLGDGTQQKTYLHVEELIDAMTLIRNTATEKINYFNIGNNDNGVSVRYIAEEVVKIISPGATINYGSGNKGWVGDVPRFTYSIDKLLSLGWVPKLNSAESVKKAIIQIKSEMSL